MLVSSAPGKINLTGEYASIYGKLVTLAGVQLRTSVAVENRTDDFFQFESDKSNIKNRLIAISELKRLWENARSSWNLYSVANDLSLLMKFRSQELIAMMLSSGLVLSLLPNNRGGASLRAISDLPIGSGLGSSSAICAATIGSLMALFDLEINKKILNQLVYSVEEIMHGRPSGGDNTGVVYGGLISFKRLKNAQYLIKEIDYKNNFPKCILIQSGIPRESTAEMVSKIGKYYEKDKDKYDNLMDHIGKLGKNFQNSLKAGVFDSRLITENERLLEQVGVVGSKAKKIIEIIENNRGYAKVCGAGGVDQGSGIILAIHPEEDVLIKLANKYGWEYYATELGGLGWHIES